MNKKSAHHALCFFSLPTLVYLQGGWESEALTAALALPSLLPFLPKRGWVCFSLEQEISVSSPVYSAALLTYCPETMQYMTIHYCSCASA